MTTLASSVSAVALGAAAMYLLEPNEGRRRRALLRDQFSRSLASFDDTAGVTWRDSRNRLQGFTSRLRRVAARNVPDGVLIERVRSRLGRATSHPKAVHVLASDGCITLQGAILDHERDGLVRAARSTPGVVDVIDRLYGFADAGDIPSLQGGRERRQLPEWRQSNWSPAMRALTGIASLSLIGFGLFRRNPLGLAALASGSALLVRSASNEPLREIGYRAMRGRIDVRKSIMIQAPLEHVFETLSRYENLPQIIRNVLRVQELPGGISHWEVAGPAGVPVEWDAETTRYERNRLLEWRSLPGSTVQHAGSITFEPVEGRATRIHVRMRYRPPAGAIGHVGAKLFGADAQSELEEDLLRLKTTIETGRLPRDAAARSARYHS